MPLKFGHIFFVICSVIVICVYCKKEKLELTSVGDCDMPKTAYASNPINHFSRLATVKNKQTFQFNFTIDEKTLPVLNTIRGYKKENNKKRLEYTIANLTCNNPVASTVLRKLHLKFDKNCCLLPGVVVVDAINMDELLTKRNMEVGHIIHDVQFHTRKGILFCLTIGVQVL